MPETDIILLDIPTVLSGPISPNTWKVRLALNYKKLKYRTQWVHASMIEETCKSLGIGPTGIKPDGSPHYTLPAIIDRTTANGENPVLLADSMPIVEYLEKTYLAPSPATELFPKHTRPFQVLFIQFVMPKLSVVFPDLVVNALYHSKPLSEQPLYRKRMENLFRKPLEVLEKRGDEREAVYSTLEQVLGVINVALGKEEGPFLAGRQASFADFALASWLIWLKEASREDLWARIASWNGGNWPRYLSNFEEWMTVDNYPVIT